MAVRAESKIIGYIKRTIFRISQHIFSRLYPFRHNKIRDLYANFLSEKLSKILRRYVQFISYLIDGHALVNIIENAIKAHKDML